MNLKCICKVCGQEYTYVRSTGCSKEICSSCRQNYRKKILKKRAIEYKGGKCQKCGYNACENALTFHHLEPEKKSFGIAQKYNIGWEKLKKELDKCILLCANCHAELHAREQYSIEDYEKWITPKDVRKKRIQNQLVEEEKKKDALCTKYGINREILETVRLGGRKVQRPTKEEFFKEYEEVGRNKSEMGRRYGVSGKAIAKWIKSYEKYGV